MNSDPALVHSMYHFLLEAGLQTFLIVPLILAIQALAGNRLSPTTKHALWFILLVRLSVPIFPESSFSLFQITQIPEAIRTEQSLPDSQGTVFQTNLEDTAETAWIPSFEPNIQAEFPLEPSPANTVPPSIETPDYSTDLVPSALATEALPVHPTSPNQSQDTLSIPKIVVSVWLLGLIILGLTLVRNALHYRHLTQSATPVRGQRLLSILNECRSSLGLSRSILAVESPTVTAPAILGFLHPQLMLPSNIETRYKTSELRHIILHELAHVQRLDPIWNWWATIVQIIHWPNPFVWYAIARQRGDRELAADYLALKALQADRPEAYGRTLIKTLNGLSRQKTIPGLIGISEDRRSLKKRFRMIAAFHRKRRYSLATLVAVISPLLALLLTDPKSHQAIAQEQPTATDSKSNSESLKASNKASYRIAITMTDAHTGTPLPNIPIGYSYDPHWFSSASPINLAGETSRTGEIQISIPKRTNDSSALTLLALPIETYTAQSKTWQIQENPSFNIPERYHFKVRRGTTIGGVIERADGQPAANIAIALGNQTGRLFSQEVPDSSPPLLRVPFSHGLKTDELGRWAFTGAPANLDYVELSTKDPNGNRTQFETGKFLGSVRIKAPNPLELADLLVAKSRIQLPRVGQVTMQIQNSMGQAIPAASIHEFASPERKLLSSKQSNRSGIAQFGKRSQKEIVYVVEHAGLCVKIRNPQARRNYHNEYHPAFRTKATARSRHR